MSKRAARNWLFLAGTVFILAAILLFLFNTFEDQQAKERVETVLPLIRKATPPPVTQSGITTDAASAIPNAAEIDRYIPDYVLNPNMEMPTVEAEGDKYIGTLYFPSLKLELPVMSSWSYPDLKKAPCLYSGSIYTGNAVIAGHNYASHFGQLTKLNPGDAVYFTDVDGNVFTYEVVLLEVLEPTAIEEMTAGDCDLSLFTCTLSGQSRFTVRCDRR